MQKPGLQAADNQFLVFKKKLLNLFSSDPQQHVRPDYIVNNSVQIIALNKM